MSVDLHTSMIVMLFADSMIVSKILSLSLFLFQHWYDENKLPCIYKNKDLLVSLFLYGNATNNIMKLGILYLTVIILVAFQFWDFLAISIIFLKFLYVEMQLIINAWNFKFCIKLSCSCISIRELPGYFSKFWELPSG